MRKFKEARIVCGNKVARIEVMSGLKEHDCMRKEDTGNLFGYEDGE